CGDALEGLGAALGDDAAVKEAQTQKSPTRDLWARLQRVRGALFDLSHLGRHFDPPAQDTEWARADAVAFFGMTASIVRQCAARAILEEIRAAKGSDTANS